LSQWQDIKLRTFDNHWWSKRVNPATIRCTDLIM
jgi:hypothetical protein